jgi:FlaA1/EpsC-like NDP-sugar epimerase
MGKPVSIYEMAERMIRNSGRNVSIEVVGLRIGEKMHEELFGNDEPDRRPIHPLISHVVAAPLSPNQIDAAATDPRHEMLRLLSL